MIIPRELIRARRRKGRITPLYLKQESIGLAKTLIAVYDDHKEEKKGDLEEALSECEQLGYNYKIVRGMSKILESLCVFQSTSKMDPRKARSVVFMEAGRRTIVNEKERLDVLTSVAQGLGISPKKLDESIYADLEEEHRLVEFDDPAPLELIKRYNFALTVALLAYSRKLSFTYNGSNRYLNRLAKKLEGTLSSNSKESFIQINLDETNRLAGRASKLEEMLAGLLNEDGWSLNASIVYPAKYNRAYLMELAKEKDAKWMIAPSFEEEIIIEIPDKPDEEEDYEDIIVLEDIARRTGSTIKEAKKKILEGNRNYKDLGGVLMTPKRYVDITSTLQEQEHLNLGSAKRLLKKEGCDNPIPVLEEMGYIIDWRRPLEESRVYRL